MRTHKHIRIHSCTHIHVSCVHTYEICTLGSYVTIMACPLEQPTFRWVCTACMSTCSKMYVTNHDGLSIQHSLHTHRQGNAPCPAALGGHAASPARGGAWGRASASSASTHSSRPPFAPHPDGTNTSKASSGCRIRATSVPPSVASLMKASLAPAKAEPCGR